MDPQELTPGQWAAAYGRWVQVLLSSRASTCLLVKETLLRDTNLRDGIHEWRDRQRLVKASSSTSKAPPRSQQADDPLRVPVHITDF